MFQKSSFMPNNRAENWHCRIQEACRELRIIKTVVAALWNLIVKLLCKVQLAWRIGLHGPRAAIYPQQMLIYRLPLLSAAPAAKSTWWLRSPIHSESRRILYAVNPRFCSENRIERAECGDIVQPRSLEPERPREVPKVNFAAKQAGWLKAGSAYRNWVLKGDKCH